MLHDKLTFILLRDGSFSIFFKRSFRYENDDEKNEKRNDLFKNDSFLMEIVLKNDRYSFTKISKQWVGFKNDRFSSKTKRSFLKTIELI